MTYSGKYQSVLPGEIYLRSNSICCTHNFPCRLDKNDDVHFILIAPPLPSHQVIFSLVSQAMNYSSKYKTRGFSPSDWEMLKRSRRVLIFR